MNLEEPETCVDEFGNLHVTAKKLGSGGQGVVLRTSDPDIVVKFALRKDGEGLIEDPQDLEAYRRKLRAIRMLPIPRGARIAAPAALLQGHSGYVMRLLEGLDSFSRFFPGAPELKRFESEEAPFWLEALRKQNPALVARLLQYRHAGNLRLRLSALAGCASVLARLHGAGLAYRDLSPANVFVSGDGRRVWLIDADNLRYAAAAPGGGAYTPKYGAPEIERGEGGRSFHADAHAFATLAFWMLSMSHPFLDGELVQGEADWMQDGEDDDPETRALRGELPWIDDEEDDSNSAPGRGLPRALLLTPQLKGLFQRCFGPGRRNPELRPGLHLWPEALERAEALTTQCGCGMAYFGSDHALCPYCRAPGPPHLRCEAWDWPLRDSRPDWLTLREAPEEGETRLSGRLFAPFSHLEDGESSLAFAAEGEGFRLRLTESGGGRVLLADSGDGGAFRPLTNEHLTREELRRGVLLFAQGAPARLVRLTLLDPGASS